MSESRRARPILVIVDDEPDVLRSLYDQFRMDYRVETFNRPDDALAFLSKNQAGVVMSDQRMPERNGVEFLREVQRIQPDATRLLFTGYSDIRAVIDAINEGNVFRYITKPWDHNELASIIRQSFRVHELIIDRKKAMEELREANARLQESNRIKAAFIEVASHELNTPVAVVLGLTELWKLQASDNSTPAERSWIDRIHHAAARLAQIIERMLKLVRAEQLDHTLELRPTDLESLIRDVVSELQPFTSNRDQTIELQLAPNLGSAHLDESKIHDVLTNLLANAIKFTADGGTIRVVAIEDGPDQIRFSVIDPGVGIPLAERKHLFEPFFTCYDSLRHSSGEFQYCKRGIGLGLHLVKRFVEMHGGQVEVMSVPNEGSNFSVILPRRPPILAPGSFVAG